jgi:hypothetical protein
MKRSHTPPAKMSSPTVPAKSAIPLEAEIRARAYKLYEQRGKEAGHELDDWLQAESDLMPKKANAAGA